METSRGDESEYDAFDHRLCPQTLILIIGIFQERSRPLNTSCHKIKLSDIKRIIHGTVGMELLSLEGAADNQKAINDFIGRYCYV